MTPDQGFFTPTSEADRKREEAARSEAIAALVRSVSDSQLSEFVKQRMREEKEYTVSMTSSENPNRPEFRISNLQHEVKYDYQGPLHPAQLHIDRGFDYSRGSIKIRAHTTYETDGETVIETSFYFDDGEGIRHHAPKIDAEGNLTFPDIERATKLLRDEGILPLNDVPEPEARDLADPVG